MDESEENLSSEDIKSTDSPMTVKSKPKKRSLIERELETSLTARITSPVASGDGTNTSRYGRARRLKSEIEQPDVKKVTTELKSPSIEKSPVRAHTQSPAYKMHASNSPLKRTESPKNVGEKFLDNQIENIYQENISLSRFGNEELNVVAASPVKKFPKVYIRKDLIQKREPEDTVNVIQNMFSPTRSVKKSSSTHLNNILERSSERYDLNNKSQNGYIDNSSVVKTLDFDSKKKKRDSKDSNAVPSKSELFDMEAKCQFQVGDLAWARMGSYPFWPSIVTRDPSTGIFVKKKLFGRIERDVIHVTFFGDNGRRGWIVDSMLRKYLGQLEFEAARENFTVEAKKKDPKLYAAYFVSEKKLPLWNMSVEEAEMLLREPKRLRIDIFYEMLEKSRTGKAKQAKGKISRTDSDVSLSESLYDSLFSEDDGKSDNNDRSRTRQRKKSLDMFEVVTACLDNMAAKTGITKIQRQSHMDRWLQKAKSKTPEKTKAKTPIPTKKEEKKEPIVNVTKKKMSTPKKPLRKHYSLRKSNESQNLLNQGNSLKQDDNLEIETDLTSITHDSSKLSTSQDESEICVIAKVESLAKKTQDKDKSVKSETSNETMTTESPKESSIDINGTLESETYTEESEESIDGAVDKQKSDFSVPNSDTAVKDFNSECSFSTELQDSSKIDLDLEMDQSEKHNKINVKPNDQDVDSQDSDLNFQNSIETEKAPDGLDSQSFNSDKPNMAQSESSNDDFDSLKYDSDKEDSIELIEISNKNLNTDIITVRQETSAATVCTELQTHASNATCITDNLTDKNVNTINIDINTENSHSESVNIDKSNIENNHDSKDITNSADDYKENDASTAQENLKSIPDNSKEDDLDNDNENEADSMSIDDDSDSERLPYSPLSNLGNNSDDNLSLDELPFVNDKVPEIGQPNLDITNKQDADELCTIVDDGLNKYNCNSSTYDLNNDIVKYNLSKTSEKYASVETDNSASEKFELNGDISDENKTINITGNKENCNIEVNILEHKVDLINNIKDDNTQDDDNINNGYRGENVRELEMASKEVRIYVTDKTLKKTESIKENGFHNTNGDFDVETASIHSEDSVTSSKSESRNKLRSKPDKKLEDPLLNPEFVKYMELRQDAIIDENPDLNENEIVAYLYKTWLYEESVKSDDKKNDDLREFNLVKGLNQPEPKDPVQIKRNLSLNKHRATKTNTIQKYLRKNKDDNREKHIETDEICSLRKRGVRKNMIKDDDDEILVKEDEKQVSLNIVQKVADLPLDKEQENENNQEKLNPLNENEFTNSEETSSSNIVPETNERLCSDFKKPPAAVSLEPSSLANFSPTQESELMDTKTEKKQQTDTTNSVKESLSEDKGKYDGDKDSLDSEDSEAPLIKCKLRSKAKKEKEGSVDRKVKDEDADTISINSEDSEISVTKRRKKFTVKKIESAMEDPEFVKYLELRQDALIDENPDLTQNEIITYLYQTFLYEENNKSETKKSDEIKESNLVKGLKDAAQEPKKVKRKILKTEKDGVDEEMSTKEKPKRKSVKPFYNEEYSDIEEELEVFEIFKPKQRVVSSEVEPAVLESEQLQRPVEVYDEVELYFAELTKPKPNIFKGLIREKVCEICEKIGSLVKCKGCNGMFHVDCVNKEVQVVEVSAPTRGRKKKKKTIRRPKNSEDIDTDDRSQDTIEDNNISVEEIIEADPHTVDADVLESLLSAKMKEILDSSEKIDYESYSSDDGLDWNETLPGKCEIVDVKLKPRRSMTDIEYADFKCNNCQKYNTPVCFVCKNAVSKNDSIKRQKCHVAHCHKYYHLECLDQWPQTHFNGGAPSKTNKKINEYFEALTCPRHVCHTCVSDDPRGCKTRFSGDKLARCVRCPATYHSFTKCLPAGSQILTASHIICPRHYEHRPGKVPCHVNTGWCFICALGGSLICCEYCPTSFHAECLSIDPPEGGYMCEDCETGRLPLYGEMVWVKLGHYRWWPGIILHPYEIPENLLAVKHSLGEFVVRFFGQYDHYWVNRGRVFPFQEGDSGRISSQKSKIDAAFTTAMEHAQRACEILKKAQPNEEESLDIASSLLPPHYVKLKVNKPCGSLCGRKLDDPESSLTQCECNPLDEDPCGPYSQCLNRMLLTECGPTCRAGDRCNNRAFEKRLYPKLVPYRTPSRGWGLKTLEDIKAGQFVIEYVGELIDEEEFRRRMRRKHEIRDENFYFLTLDKERMIDAGPKGNLARFMNHCCEPNCETQKWTVLGDVRVGLFALYDIKAHSEVTFNYNLECAGIDKKRCMCGAKRCSGYIGAKPKQEESQTKKNKMHPGKRTYKKRKPEESPSTKNKPKRPIGRPPKPKELTEIEKDLLIIRNATNGLSSDESSRSLSSEYDRNPKALKRKRVSFSTEEVIVYDGTESPNVKKSKLEDKLEGD
ncbi:unnamed protein product [Arctia plantaginis]|uniref:Uncharacterized protein n=1 Tax=Arctia plantaginis TaxID=874455 RepID=A0A8S0YUH4_ARCPL|nr:unnamed protein product [Arctia plantaginis]